MKTLTGQKALEAMKDEYLKPTPDRQVDQFMVNLISRFVIARLTGKRILELGVGDQIWTPQLVDKFPDVTTVDASSKLLGAMRQKLAGKRWTPVVSFFEKYKPRRRFDVVLATFVLEHVDDPAVILRMANQKWLKPGGTLAVVVPHALSLHRRLAVAMGLASHSAELSEPDFRMGHQRCLTCFEMEKLIVQAGFKVMERKGMFTKPLPNGLLTHCTDKQLEGLFELGLQLPIEYSGTIFFLAKKL